MRIKLNVKATGAKFNYFAKKIVNCKLIPASKAVCVVELFIYQSNLEIVFTESSPSSSASI